MRTFSYLVLGGILTGLSLNIPNFWFMAFFGLLPLLYVVYTRKTTLSVFVWGWFWGVIYVGLALIWFWDSLPLNWLGIDSVPWSIVYAFVGWSIVALPLSLFIGLWTLTAYLFVKHVPPRGPFRFFLSIVILSSLWVLFEYARIWGFAVLTAGSGSLFVPYFSVGFIGYTLAANQMLLQLASIGGVYMLSFVVVFVSGVLYWFFFRLQLKTSRGLNLLFVGTLIFFLVVSLPIDSLSREQKKGGVQPLTVAVINTYFPTTSLWRVEQRSVERFQALQALLQQVKVSGKNVDIVVFPEDSRFLQTAIEEGKLLALHDITGGVEALFVDTGSVKTNSSSAALQQMLYYNTTDGNIISQDKRLLVPIGEYMPSSYKTVLQILQQKKSLETIERYRSYTTQNTELRSGYVHGASIGALFCSENLSPTMYTSMALGGADVLVNTSASAWFHKSRILHNQMVNIVKVRAVEANRYMVRSANMAPAFVVDNQGNIVAEMPWEEEGILYSEVLPIQKQSMYSKIVDIFSG